SVVMQGGPSGNINVFARGGDGNVWAFYRRASDGWWSPWARVQPALPVAMTGTPAALTSASGALLVFARGAEGHVCGAAPQSDGSWTAGGALPLAISNDPAPLVRPGGGLAVYVRGNDGAAWEEHQLPSGDWSTPASLGGGIQ